MSFDYQPVYFGRRIISWIIDFIVVFVIPSMILDYYSLEKEYSFLLGIMAIFVFSLIDSSPGKLFLRLKLFNEDRT